MQFLFDEIRMASNGKEGGKSEMSWYAEVILSYIIIEKQSDMERRHGSPHIVYKPFFFSHNSSVVFITESHEEFWGKSDGYGWKKKKKEEISGCSAICPEKCLWMVCCKQKSISYTIYPFLFRGGKKNVPQEIMNHCWV